MSRLQRGFLGVGTRGLSWSAGPPACLPTRVWLFRDVPPRDEGSGWVGPASNYPEHGAQAPQTGWWQEDGHHRPHVLLCPASRRGWKGPLRDSGRMALSRLRALTTQLASSCRACPLGCPTAPSLLLLFLDLASVSGVLGGVAVDFLGNEGFSGNPPLGPSVSFSLDLGCCELGAGGSAGETRAWLFPPFPEGVWGWPSARLASTLVTPWDKIDLVVPGPAKSPPPSPPVSLAELMGWLAAVVCVASGMRLLLAGLQMALGGTAPRLGCDVMWSWRRQAQVSPASPSRLGPLSVASQASIS